MKAVESSTVVAFRALVMLACLIVVPLAAIFGSAFPDIVRSALIDPLLGNKPAPTVRGQDAPGAPSFGSSFAATSTERVSPTHDGGMAPAWGTVGSAAAAPAGPNSGSPGPLGMPAATIPANSLGQPQAAMLHAVPGQDPGLGSPTGFNAPVDASAAPAWPASQGPRQGTPAGYAPAAIAGNNPAAAPLPGAAPVIASLPAAVQTPTAPDGFSRLERRLRDYGAIYYLLETWGNEGELYRFHCKMAIASNPNHTRHFEATHRDALQAMNQVLDQIEVWRSGRLP